MDPCGLLDLYSHLHQDTVLPYHWRGKENIDFVLVSPDVIPCVNKATIPHFDLVFHSDHRPIFLDLDISAFLERKSAILVGISSRSFSSKNPKHLYILKKSISIAWILTQQIQNSSQKSVLPKTAIQNERLQAAWRKLDAEIGWVFFKLNPPSGFQRRQNCLQP